MPLADKDARREYALAYAAENREKRRQCARDCYHRNKDKKPKEPKSEERKAYERAYRKANAERVRAVASAYQLRPQVKAKNSAYEKTPDRAERKRAERKKWATENPTLVASRNLKWRQENRDLVADYARAKYHENVNHKIRLLLRNRLNLAIKNRSIKGSAVRLLGCSIEQFVEHIERGFSPDMSWKNWGSVWHIDHIKPLASFDLTDPLQLAEACNFTNLQPLPAIENFRKGAKLAA